MSVPAAPDKNGQFQPNTSTSSKDCVAAVTAMLVERALTGRVRPTHADIRKLSGAPSTRGLYDGEAAKAAEHYGVKLEVKLGQSRVTLRDTVGNGRACGVSIDTGVTLGGPRATNQYDGPHKVFAQAHSLHRAGSRCACEKAVTYEHGEFTVEDPGTTTVGYKQWSADLLYRAAEKRGGGKINLIVAPDTESVTWVAIAGYAVRSEPTYASGTKLGVLVKGARYKGGRTQNGQAWNRADGTAATQWIHLLLPNGKWGWAKGPGLALV